MQQLWRQTFRVRASHLHHWPWNVLNFPVHDRQEFDLYQIFSLWTVNILSVHIINIIIYIIIHILSVICHIIIINIIIILL